MALEKCGIDNIIFISILVGRLPEHQRNKRQIGLGLAMGSRLLCYLVWQVMGLVNPLFSLFGNEISGRDIILVLGGLFLIAKSTHEIHASFEVTEASTTEVAASGFSQFWFKLRCSLSFLSTLLSQQ